MTCLEAFLNKPVMIQLKQPLLSAISAEEVEGEDGEKYGSATLAFFPAEAGKPPQPVMLQVIRGEIEEYDDKHALVATMGGDNITPVRICVERENMASTTFCVQHIPKVEQPPTPSIITPGN